MKKILGLTTLAVTVVVAQSLLFAQTVATPALSPVGGSLSSLQTISMSTSTPGAGIWYTTDGSTPTLPEGGVPTGTSSGYTPMCQPYPMPPLSGLKNIAAYGASTGASDNTTAIVNACNAAGAPTATNGIYVPAGTFAMTSGSSSVGTTLNCNIYGQGPSSNLYCPNPTTPVSQLGNSNCQLYSTANNAVWSNFQHSIAASSRDAQNFNIRIVGATGHRNDTLLLVHGNAGGFFSDGTTGEIDTNNGVIGAYADSNYHTDGATNSTTDHTYVYGSGDDSDSNVSYMGEPEGPVNGSLVQWNNLTTPTRGRGATVPGGENITFQNNLISNMTFAGIYIAQEAPTSYNESGVSNVILRYNYIQNSNIPNNANGQAGILLYSGNSSGTGVTNIQILGNYVVQNTANGAYGTALETQASPGTISDISFINNTMTGDTGDWSAQGTSTSVTCSGNTYNSTPSNTSTPCGGTNPDTATGSPVTYSGCVVGTARQYTGPIRISASSAVKAVAVFPGLTNSSVESGTYTTGAETAYTPTFTPASGIKFSGTQAITLADATPGSAIFYYVSSPAIQIITTVGPSITDGSGYVWTITSGAQMAINGNTISVTSNVVEIVYINENVWQLNTANNWYEVTSVTSPTVPTVGFGSATTTSPMPAYSTYSGPINISASSSITAYATASGVTQSSTMTATYTSVTRTVVSGYLRSKSGATSMTMGSTMQLIAHVTYSDGTTGTLPDAAGNVATWWNTTNHKVAVISSQGRATGLSQGSINMEAMVGTLRVSPWQVIVGAATPAVKAAPVSAIQSSTAANTGEAAVPAQQNALTAVTPGPVPAAPGGPLPDTFLGPFWRIVAPAGGSASISNSHLFLGVPGGGNHDTLRPSNQAVRVVQTIGNEDFDVVVKIDSPLLATDGNTSQGLMVLSGSEDFITFALTTDGTKIGLSARTVTEGAATTALDETDFSQYQNPMYLRVMKAGSAYLAFYSVDGANWTQAASFTDTTIFTSIGPFASNYDSTPANAPPVVMSVNWFDVRQ